MSVPVATLDMSQGGESYDRFLKVGGLAILILFLLVIVWGSLAQIKGAVIAPGTLVVESKPKVVQHLDGGIVGEIFVKDGDIVSENQVLMRLDPTVLEASRQIVETRYYETLARVARLQAERDALEQIAWPEALTQQAAALPAIRAAMAGQTKLFETRRATSQGTIKQLGQRIAQTQSQISGLQSLIESQDGQLGSLTLEIKELKRGVEKGVVSQNRYNAMIRERIRLEGEVQRNSAEITRFQNVISENRVTMLQVKRDFDETVLSELRAAQTEASDYKEQLTSAADQRQRIDVRAPSGGIVHNLLITTIGGVVRAGEEIMQIIPQNERLLVEAQVQPQDIDQIYVGQPATIRLSAFNQRKTPELNGRVLQSSANSLVDPMSGFPYYSVRVEIPVEELRHLGPDLQLLPGMPAEAFMQTDSRSVISYLVKPATDAMQRSFREE